jgi:hypothetical protein
MLEAEQMKTARRSSLLIIVFLLVFSSLPSFSGCGLGQSTSSTTFPGVLAKSKDDSLSITVPVGWNTNDTSIWSSAVLGASDDAKFEYAIVIRHAKSEYASGVTVEQYMTSMKSSFNLVITDPVWSESSNTSINKLKGASIQLTGNSRSSGIKLAYWISVVADDSNFYEIVAYTHEDLVSSNQSTLKSIIASFKVLA